MPRRKDYIHKRKDGRWEGRYFKERTKDGRIVYGSVYGKTYQEVKEKRLKKLKDTDNKVSKNNPKFSDVLDNWMIHIEINVKKSTLYKYHNIVEQHIKPDLGNYKLYDLNTNIFNQYISYKLHHGRISGKGSLSSSYVKTITIILQSVLKYASKQYGISIDNIDIPKPSVKKKEIQILSTKDYNKIKKYLIDQKNLTNLAIALSLFAGLRIGEVCALQWKDIQLDNRVLKVRHSIVRVSSDGESYLMVDEPKTESSIRDIPIVKPLYIYLKEFASSDLEKFVISNDNHFIQQRTLEYRYKKVLKECDIDPINFHALRHTFATRCIQAGVDIKSLSEILGHSNVSITLNTYVHSSMDIKKEQMNKLELIDNGQ